MPNDRSPDDLNPELAALDPALERVTDQGGAAPGASQPGASAGEGDRNAAMGLSSMVVGILAAGIARRWPATAYTEAEKESLAVVLCPVLMKYGLTAAWLEKYRAEFSLLGVLFLLGKTGMDRVAAASAAAPAPEGAIPVD